MSNETGFTKRSHGPFNPAQLISINEMPQRTLILKISQPV